MDSYMQMNETGPLYYTISKNKLKVDWRLHCKVWNHKTARRKDRQWSLTLVSAIVFFISVFSGEVNKSKNKQWDDIKLRRFCLVKTTINKMKGQPWMGEDNCKYICSDRLISRIYRQLIKKQTNKEPASGFTDSVDCFFSLYVIYCSNLISLLTLDFVCCCSSSSFRCRGRVFIWDFSILFRKACIPMNFPLRTAFALSHRFCVVCSFSFVSRYFFYLLLHLIVNTFIIIIF